MDPPPTQRCERGTARWDVLDLCTPVRSRLRVHGRPEPEAVLEERTQHGGAEAGTRPHPTHLLSTNPLTLLEQLMGFARDLNRMHDLDIVHGNLVTVCPSSIPHTHFTQLTFTLCVRPTFWSTKTVQPALLALEMRPSS